MQDTTVKKIDSSASPTGGMGQTYLATGKSLSMRLWKDEQPNPGLKPHARPYETVGYCISGKAELHLGGQTLVLSAGDSWVVPKDAEHHYKILEAFTAVEATHPPAEQHGRDGGVAENE